MFRAVCWSCLITGLFILVAVTAPTLFVEIGAFLALIPIRFWEMWHWRRQISNETALAILRDAEEHQGS